MTAAISRSTSSNQVEELDSAPAKPPASVQHRKPDAPGNRVENWSGFSQTQRPSVDEVVAQIETKMKKNSWAPVRDFAVTERDARESVALLGQLPAPEYKKALESMSIIARTQLLSEMDADTRKDFFKQAVQKGALKEQAGVKAPPREGSPPDKPALLRNDASLSNELRTAIHEENKDRTAKYMKEFDGYVSRYADAARNASSPLALRLMGPPMGEFVMLEPGLVGKDNARFGSLEQGPTQRARAAQAANDRISDFAGRTRAGSFSATFESKLAADFKGTGGEAKYSATVTDYGKATGTLKGEAEVSIIPGLSVGITSDGKHYQEASAGDFKLRREGGKFTEVEGKVAGFGIALTEDKTTLSLGAGAIPVGVYAAIDEKRGSYGAGLKAGGKQELGGLTLEASVKVGFTVQGIAPERLGMIASMTNDGIWGPMPELDNRVKWNDITKVRRDRLASDGWSPSNWPVR